VTPKKVKKTSGITFRSLNTLFLAASGALLVILFLYLEPKFLKELEHRTWDWRAKRLAERSAPSSEIKIIAIDQATLDFFANEYALTWPFPREIYSHLIDFLATGQAKGVAFDILFTESSAQSPEGDKIFAESVAQAKKLQIVHSLVLTQNVPTLKSDHYSDFILQQKQKKISHLLPDSRIFSLPQYSDIQLPIPELIEARSDFGYVQAGPDSDGIFRNHAPLSLVQDTEVLSLPFSLMHAGNGEEHIRKTFNRMSPDGSLIVRLHEKEGRTYEYFSFAEIIQSMANAQQGIPPTVPPETFRDAWVFVGTTAPGLLDFRPTSTKERGDGVEFLANTFDSLLHDNFIIRVSTPLAAIYIVLHLIFPLLVKEYISRFHLQIAAWILGLVFSFIAIEWSAWSGYWLPFVAPFSIYGGMVLGSISLQYLLEGKQHRFLRKAFQQYVSPSLIEQIVVQPDLLSLGGEKKEVSILFSDIAGFTSASEKLEASALVQLLNEYLSLMSDIILKHQGTVDKYIGDAVLAFWNAPLSVPDHAERAVLTACECQKALTERKNYFEKKYGLFPETRIGINTAVVSVGNFGSEARFDYTVIGDGVNLASRLEGTNKIFGTNILVSETSMKASQSNIAYRPVGEVRVMGKNQSIKIFEPLTADNSFLTNPELLQTYLEAYEAFHAMRLDEAKRLFSLMHDDPVSKSYLKRLESESISTLVWEPSSK
jgi:adenylate cyclase